MNKLLIYIINFLGTSFLLKKVEEINLKGNLYGLDVYLVNNKANNLTKIVECLGIGLLITLII